MLSMCGRYTITFGAKTLAEAFGMVSPGFHIMKGYNITPGQHIVIVRPEKDHLVAELAHWGSYQLGYGRTACRICEDRLRSQNANRRRRSIFFSQSIFYVENSEHLETKHD